MKNFVLIGEMGAGKDTAASFMIDHIPIAFADELKIVAKCLRVNGVEPTIDYLKTLFDGKEPKSLKAKLQEFKTIPKESDKDRKLLQEIGTYCRMYDKEIWIRAALSKLKPNKAYVITDCRNINELIACHNLGFVSVYIDAHKEIRKARIINRDGFCDTRDFYHQSEREIPLLAKKCKWVVNNDENELACLENGIDIILEEEKCK